MRLTFSLAVPLVLLPLGACMMPPNGQYGANNQPAVGGPSPCDRACAHYLECKSASTPENQQGCVNECQVKGSDQAAVDQLATADCPTIVSVFDSAAGQSSGAAQNGIQGGSTPPANCPGAGSGELTALLSRSPWCHFSYSGASGGGTSSQERIVFQGNGQFTLSGGSESSYSGQQTNQYGDQTGAWGANGSNSNTRQGCWKTDGTTLSLSPNGQTWNQPMPVSVSQNSNGAPIINANGKEYYTCN